MTRGLRRQYETANGVRVVQVAHHAGGVRATLDGEEVPFDARRARRVEGGVELLISATAGLERAVVVRDGDTVHVHLRGRVHRLEVARRGAAGGHAAADEDEPFAASPMTGVVMKVLVETGDAVATGRPLFMVEAMKMEFVVQAPRDVVVDEVRVAAGDRVEIGQVVVTYTDDGGAQ